ncbi:hypothetical protein H9L05_15730 [Hymenobacter qilianensis]|uniref:Restriction endonuclease n=1 Tax=Hymenobacter qilianensis TaxID=1385715 RepID=A0A7H0GT44_9BACT|nr:hypothetical protein [Hymenobacter qilianensis]QNP51460.1 hypothetical protein H9L05_15730 [Hymenobacter qilianensis]
MRFPTIQIEGAILSAELLDQLESGAAAGQKPTDFGLPLGNKLVKDEILRAWADANDYWRIFRRRLDALADDRSATTETRRQWLLPLLGLLGYDAQPLTTSPTAGEKKFAISHTDARRAGLPLHLVSARDELDTRPDGRNGRRPTPHGLVQEYLNLTEHLYGLLSNGLQLRLLRDSSRLVRLSYVEFDLERMFTEGHFADFALLWRLLHASRMPTAEGKGAESLIERYHQDALEAGARIRERLSAAVYNSLLALGNGFLQHPDNDELRTQLISGKITAALYHQHLLRLIYRFLFLLVTEERDLLFPETANPTHREVYEKYYSLQKLRRLCENPYLPADSKTFHDLWAGLRQTFQLFESGQAGQPLGLSPLLATCLAAAHWDL